MPYARSLCSWSSHSRRVRGERATPGTRGGKRKGNSALTHLPLLLPPRPVCLFADTNVFFSCAPFTFPHSFTLQNDFHARYAQQNRFNSPCDDEDAADGKCYSSIPRLAQAFGQFSCDLRIHAGDFVQGSVYDTIFGTDIAISAYNTVQYDIAVLGNHEFNKGAEPVVKTIAGTPKTTWIASNVDFMGYDEAALNVSKAVDAYDICWVSALTTATLDISSPGDSVAITEPKKALEKAIKSCAQNDNVIAVNHLGFEQDKAMCEAIPELDLVIGGHSHTNLNDGMYPYKVEREDGSICWVVSAFAYGRYLGVLDIDFDDGVIEIGGEGYIPMDGRVDLEKGTDKMLSYFRSQLTDAIQKEVGVAAAPIDGERSSCRAEECQMGILVCEAMLAYAGPKQGAQLCIQNGGGLRASVNEGPITVEEVLTVLPFGNVHAVVDITGAGVVAALENGFLALGNDEITGRYPQVGGMVVEVNPEGAPGSRVVSVTIDGSPIDTEATYTLVTNSFLAGGGDGYEWTGSSNLELSGRGLNVLVGEYLGENNPYTPSTPRRIVYTSA